MKLNNTGDSTSGWAICIIFCIIVFIGTVVSALKGPEQRQAENYSAQQEVNQLRAKRYEYEDQQKRVSDYNEMQSRIRSQK
jgi:uncharacterized protein YlxW (UPF0749 family)